MAQVELIMPKMGESIMEATILKWLKKEGDRIEEEESVLEIATDKVDSEVPAPTEGVISKILFEEGETVEVGKVIAIIQTEADSGSQAVTTDSPTKSKSESTATEPVASEKATPTKETSVEIDKSKASRFYSPLVLNIAKTENVSMDELESIEGSGLNNRVTKADMLNYLENRKDSPQQAETKTQTAKTETAPTPQKSTSIQVEEHRLPASIYNGNVEVIEMDRMRKLISKNMGLSKRISPHVTSFVEADVTNMVLWRNKIKNSFQEKEGEKITFTPLFIEAVIKALKDFPLVNISVDGDNIIRHKDLHIGMATALPSGNLIVPVIKNADQMNLVGLTKKVNDLANRARTNKLKADEIEGGTFTITNVGTFGNVMGTPIIMQPQVAILATGAIRKKPVVMETEAGDTIAIRQMMYLSLSYDHRVVDGFLGGSFLRKIADYMEAFDSKREVY
ncbi:MAG: 2-oxo acid dehydrogenase subunit E2 [Chitinophagaceae bacterium]|nr:MAG: 2-oxo acid dehydrogenase subunit E2 [Chitinophagaceae bacterium]